MRTEKGLLLKDWGLLKSQGKGIIYVMIGGAALMVGALNNSVIDREESAACFGIYITVTMAIYVANMLAYDEMDHGFQYLFSLPVTKKDYVREKYIFSISLDAAVWLLGLTITTVVSMIGNYGKGRLIIAVIVLFLGGAGVLTGKMCGRLGVNPTGIFQKIVSLSAGQLLGAGMMILVIGLTVSYQCSIKILEKKEY